MLKEFKKFIQRGNVIDLAVGVIMGGAFGKIVSSLVEDVIMPLIGIVMGGLDLTKISIKIGDANIKIGSFWQNIIDFLIIALCVFFIVKLINKLTPTKKEEKKETPAPAISKEAELLEEIRDLLKKEDKKQRKNKNACINT